MKNVKFTIIGLILFVVVFAFAFRGAQQNSEPEEHIMLEIYEVPAYNSNGIHIYYGNDQSEFIPFRKLKEENQQKNGDLIVTTINKLAKEGYEIQHVGSGLSNNGMITKIFMTRKN